MRPVASHVPGEPSAADPPAGLEDAADAVAHPLVQSTGLTCTADGRWAVLAVVPADADVPIPQVEKQANGFPVVYEAAPTAPPRAIPARPRRKR